MNTSTQKVTELTCEEQRTAGRAKLNRLVAVRDRSVGELRRRFLEDGYREEVVEELLASALRCGLLDDGRFARAYIAGKLRLGWGRMRIEYELERFDASAEMLPGYPEAFFGDDEVERAMACLSSYRGTAQNKREAYYRRLMSKGFSHDTVQRAVSCFLES